MRKGFLIFIIGISALTLFLTFSRCGGPKTEKGEIKTVEKEKTLYHCPMHPTYVADKPGDCPICGMRLVPMEKASEGETTQTATIAGRTPIGLSLERQQLIGVRSESVLKRPLAQTIRTVGEIAYDPELYSAIAEYQAAVKSQKLLDETTWPETKERTEKLLKSAELKLKLMGLSDSQIKELSSSSDAPLNLILGTEKSVWVYGQIYEYEMGLVKPGQPVEITTLAYPGKVFKGVIRALDPVLNAETRSLRFRAEVENPQGLLRPQMFLDVKIIVPLGAVLAIPDDALIETGQRKIVFVDMGDGMFEPREVEVGSEAEGYFPVTKGLSEGERVVTQANFLIDSESRLKAAIQKMGEAPEGHKH